MHLILFDIDGTLIDSQGCGRRALEDAFAQVFGLPEAPAVHGHVRFDGALDPAIHEDMARHLRIPLASLHARRDELQERYLNRLSQLCSRSGGGRVLPGVMDLVNRLDTMAHVTLGLLTGNMKAGARVKLAPHDLNRFFPEGGFGEDAPSRAEVAQVAVSRVAAGIPGGVAPEQVVVIGDSERDVQCGRANGYRTLAVGTGWTPRATLTAAGPDFLVEDLQDSGKILEMLSL